MTDDRKKYIKSLIIAAAIIAFVLILDLVTKVVTDNRNITVIAGFFYISSLHNNAAAFSSTFGIAPEVFIPIVIVFTFIACGVMLFLLIYNKKKHILFTVSLAMIFAGAVGNLIDRIGLGYVRDFLLFTFFPAVFNIADASLVCGVILLFIWILFFYMRGENKDKPMDPALVTDGAPGNLPKKKFEPVNAPHKKPDDQEKETDNSDKDKDEETDSPEKSEKPEETEKLEADEKTPVSNKKNGKKTK